MAWINRVGREGNIWIVFVLAAAAAAGAYNTWAVTTYEPLYGPWKMLVTGVTIVSLILAPSLTCLAFSKKKKWLLGLGFFVLMHCVAVGFIIAGNGLKDTSPVEYHKAIVLNGDTVKAGSSEVHRLKVQLQQLPQFVFTVPTSAENYDKLNAGMIIQVPLHRGKLGIPWQAKGQGIKVIDATVESK